MKEQGFYKTSCYGGVGSNVMFHGINGSGYASNLDSSHVYSLKEAQNEVDKGWIRAYPEQELFLSSRLVDELSVWKVDCQYVSLSYPENKDPNDEYVLYLSGSWDGNDLSFAAEVGRSYDYSSAKVFSENELSLISFDGWVAVPKCHTDEVARRTFQYKNINRRKMISGSGLIGLRKPRKSTSKGMTRWNCPCCGKINWQYNPYDFEGCSDINCDEWKLKC